MCEVVLTEKSPERSSGPVGFSRSAHRADTYSSDAKDAGLFSYNKVDATGDGQRYINHRIWFIILKMKQNLHYVLNLHLFSYTHLKIFYLNDNGTI